MEWMIWSMNILFFFQFLIDSQQFFHFSYKYQKIKIRAVINHLEIVLQYYTYAYRFILHPFGSFDVRIPLLTQCSQLHLLEQLPLSLCTYPTQFSLISRQNPEIGLLLALHDQGLHRLCPPVRCPPVSWWLHPPGFKRPWWHGCDNSMELLRELWSWVPRCGKVE